jgi:predicted transcriptional regulator
MNKKNKPKNLDVVLEALANEHRREILYILGLQPCSISKLATERCLSLPAIHKHIKVLENANMILRNKIGRTNFLTLNKNSLAEVQSWLMQFQTQWGNDNETLENFVPYLDKETISKEIENKELK